MKKNSLSQAGCDKKKKADFTLRSSHSGSEMSGTGAIITDGTSCHKGTFPTVTGLYMARNIPVSSSVEHKDSANI